MKENYCIIKQKYEEGVYSLKRLCQFVEMNVITKKEFHSITSYDYKGLKKSRGW